MRYPKLIYLLMLGNMLAVLACVCGWQWNQHESQLEHTQQFGEHLAAHLNEEPAVTVDLLSISGRAAPPSVIGLEVRSAAGKLIASDGKVIEFVSVPDEGWGTSGQYQTWRRELVDGRKLTLILSGEVTGWWVLLGLLPLALIPVWLTAKIMHQSQQHLLEPLVKLLPGNDKSGPAVIAAMSAQSIQQLQKGTAETASELGRLRDACDKLETEHQQMMVEHSQQLHVSQHVIGQLQQQQKDWQLLSTVAEDLSSEELKHWLLVLAFLQQNSGPARQQVKVHQAFAGLIRTIQPMWSPEVLILPDEDPQGIAYQAELDFSALQLVLHSMLLIIRPLVEGREVLLGYRVQQTGQLCCSLQYNGKSLPERVRAILIEGEIEHSGEFKWPDIRIDWCRQLLERSGLQWKLTELTDLGSRLEFSLPVVWQRVNHGRRWQNLVVCDPRPCRRDLWQRSLLAVSEQVVLVEQLNQLEQATSSRLIDAVVVHLDNDGLSENELSLLQNIGRRFPLALFTSKAMQTKLPAALQSYWQQSPVLVADVAKLHEQKPQVLEEKQLLVVDDNLTNLSFIRAMLSGRGINIDIAMTGAEALQLASQSRYQLILMDIQLPDISGVEVTRQLRQLRHHQKTNIFAFTAHALPEEVANFRLAGMDDVMIKPLDAGKIAHIIARLTPVTEMLSPD